MEHDPEVFPKSVDALRYQYSHFDYSKRLINPILVVDKYQDSYRARLAGTFFRNGEKKIITAQSNDSDWLLDGNLVRPLPKGICSELLMLMPDADLMDLSFSQMLSLVRQDQDLIEVSYDDSLFSAAKIDASEFDVENLSIPGLNADLFPYQAKGVLWMHKTLKSAGGLILADEMGLGKTIQIISLLLLDPPKLSAPALIVAPTTLLRNWERELVKFAPSLTHCIHHGSSRSGFYKYFQNYHVIITSYATVSEDMVMFGAFEWRYLICDEAQAIKNPSSARRANINSLKRKYTIPMTGTPVENSLMDLWSLSDFAIPGLLGGENEFAAHFPDEEAAAANLSQITDPIVLRRRVLDVAADLPERIDIPTPLVLDKLHAREYRYIRETALEEYKKAGGLVAAGRLQMFCTHPWLQGSNVNSTNEDQIFNSDSAMPFMNPKLERTKEILLEAFSNRRKVLIFVNFNKCGELIKRTLEHRVNMYWNAINGNTPADDRQKICDEFEAHDGDACLILNPRAAGAGLNITAATVVIHFSPFWNPAHELQASARAYRRGQDQPVTIYMLFYEQTLEEVMIERSELRRNLGDEALPNQVKEQEDLHRAMHIYPDLKNEYD
jgi:SNF2 family DNA or RNA helicase